MTMEAAATLAELLLKEPEILTWLEVNPDHRHERALFQQVQMSPRPEARADPIHRPSAIPRLQAA